MSRNGGVHDGTALLENRSSSLGGTRIFHDDQVTSGDGRWPAGQPETEKRAPAATDTASAANMTIYAARAEQLNVSVPSIRPCFRATAGLAPRTPSNDDALRFRQPNLVIEH